MLSLKKYVLTALIPKGLTSARRVIISDIKEMKSRWLWRKGGVELKEENERRRKC